MSLEGFLIGTGVIFLLIYGMCIPLHDIARSLKNMEK